MAELTLRNTVTYLVLLISCHCAKWLHLFFSDIQEFYEETLLDEQKTTNQKTAETNQIAEKWEVNPPIVGVRPTETKVGRVFRVGGALPYVWLLFS